jgi:class 3 adenylate cyclase
METTKSDFSVRPGEPTVGPQVNGGWENRPYGEVLQDDDGGGERYDDCGSLSASSQDDGSDNVLSELGSSLGDTESRSAVMLITNVINMPSAPTCADGEYEDGKADMIARLMKNHSNIVSSTLFERSNLISSVTWFSNHVPGCVVKSLIHSIVSARKRGNMKSRLHRDMSCHGMHDVKQLPKDEIKLSPKAEYKAQSQFLNTVPSPVSSSSPERSTSFPPTPPFMIEDSLPLTTGYDGALLFVDISGFTKISLLMDVESLSNAINSYFDMIVNEIILHGGDILKFAGDSVFAEWKVSPQKSHRDLNCCVSTAATCAATIVARCSNFPVFKAHDFKMSSRRSTVEVGLTRVDTSEPSSFPRRATEGRRAGLASLSASFSMPIATLNVKCAIGAGHIVGIHVGDNVTRREYFILGDIISQVANAERAAGMGQVFASPEAFQHLVDAGDLMGDFKEALEDGQPIRIADHDERFFDINRRNWQNPLPSSSDEQNMLNLYENMNSTELQWLRKMLSLYVHPVVVNDDSEHAPRNGKIGSFRERHLAEAELRTVYTCFISPRVEYKLTGDDTIDQKVFCLLNDIMILTTRELNRVQGHLRQFILDDKGLVLICTFGLRGSTFPDMVAQRALPFSLSIHSALERDLGVKSTVGATLGRVYCGVVGGLERHEFAVLGPSVNLAARLMASDKNPGILVDKTVRLLTNKIFFKPLPAVTAKGYEEPVPIFEPLKQVVSPERAKKNFCGRAGELKQIVRNAKEIIFHNSISKLLLITAMSGSGKSSLMDQATELIRAMATEMHRRVIVTRNISNEGDTIIPFR